jgi:transcription elongation factor Elf1
MNYNELKNLVAYLKQVMRCPRCKKNFLTKNIFILGVLPTEGIFQLNCSNCGDSIIVNAGLKSQPSKSSVINKNDVKKMKSFLNNFNGDFKKLFKSSK